MRWNWRVNRFPWDHVTCPKHAVRITSDNLKKEGIVKMAEIKSALELAMERTKNLVLDPQEKKALEEKEIGTKAAGVIRRFREGMVDRDRAARELETIPGDREVTRSVVVRMVLDEIDLAGYDEDLLFLLDSLGCRLPDASRKDLEDLKAMFLEKKVKMEKAVRERIMGKLHGLGLGGDSIQPNVEAWDEWQDGLRETEALFRQQLIDWRAGALRVTGS
jgi:hypothetical protein